jgi:hypothetical protein
MGIEPICRALQSLENAVSREAPMAACDWRANFRVMRDNVGLREAGWSRDGVEAVVCTHLHVDHVGWNTMLENGKWVPTFPKACYLIGRRE